MQKQSIEIAKYMQNQIPERIKLKEFIWNENIKNM
jgi:hypothetical protein